MPALNGSLEPLRSPTRRGRWLRNAGATAAIVLLCAGCSTIQRETHYIKSVDAFGYPVNYYRIDVRGSTALSSARYLSGYFPESVVDIYFGQIPQPANGQLTLPLVAPSAETSTALTAEGTPTKRTEIVGAPQGTKLVLLLSSHADAVAQEISNIARDEELMRNITALAHRSELRQADAAARQLAISSARVGALAEIAEGSLGTLVSTSSAVTEAAETRARVLMFLNQAAFFFGHKTPFKSLDEASAWYQQNRDTLVGR